MCRLLLGKNGKGYVVKIVDNFLPDALYKDIMTYAILDKNWTKVDHNRTCNKYEKSLPYSLINRVYTTYSESVNNLSEFGLDPEFFSVGLVKCDPGYAYPIHADKESKVISAVVYLSPLEGNSTKFSGMTNPEWKSNRLVAWKNEGQEHWYYNNKEQDRYTLNIYQTMEEVSYVVETSRDKNT